MPLELWYVQHSLSKIAGNMLQVCFFDGKRLPATVLTEQGNFCLLGTPNHEDCVGITWSHESLDPDTVVFTFVPESSKKTERKDVYLSVESVQAYLVDKVYSMEPKSDDYFMILCDYFGENVGGGNRLVAAPVFTMLGNVLGACLFPLLIRLWTEKIEDPTQTDPLILDSACRRFPRKPQHNVRADSCRSVARLAYQVSGRIPLLPRRRPEAGAPVSCATCGAPRPRPVASIVAAAPPRAGGGRGPRAGPQAGARTSACGRRRRWAS